MKSAKKKNDAQEGEKNSLEHTDGIIVTLIIIIITIHYSIQWHRQRSTNAKEIIRLLHFKRMTATEAAAAASACGNRQTLQSVSLQCNSTDDEINMQRAKEKNMHTAEMHSE